MQAYIVENSEIIRAKLALLLAEIEGLVLVGQAGSVKTATEDILKLKPDVAVVDIKLSDGNGLDWLESMQAQGSKTKNDRDDFRSLFAIPEESNEIFWCGSLYRQGKGVREYQVDIGTNGREASGNFKSGVITNWVK